MIPRAQLFAFRFTLLMALAFAAISPVFRDDVYGKVAGLVGTVLLTIFASFRILGHQENEWVKVD
jgi:uncharacterized membrane protein YccC